MYKVKNVKLFKGMEGSGFNCSLYRDNKKVAECIDSGNGGEIMFNWLDYKEPRIKRDIPDLHIKGEVAHVSFTPYENDFFDFCRKETYDGYFGKSPKTPDLKLSEMIDDFENNKRLKRLCKSKTLFRIPKQSYKDGVWHTIPHVFTPQVKEYLVKKYGNCKILNESMN
jgi:hypothetical protein